MLIDKLIEDIDSSFKGEIIIDRLYKNVVYFQLECNHNTITDTRNNGSCKNYPIAIGMTLEKDLLFINIEAYLKKIFIMREYACEHGDHKNVLREGIKRYGHVKDKFINFLECNYGITRKNKEKR